MIAGALIVSTVLLCSGGTKVYEKKLTFDSIEQIVNILDSEVISAYDNKDNQKFTDIYLECLSKRKRISGSNMNHYSSFNLEVDSERDNELIKEEIIANYLQLNKDNMKNNNVPNKIEAISVKGTATIMYSMNYYDIGENAKENEEVKMDLVFIDEGEGWVIDYMWISTNIINQENPDNHEFNEINEVNYDSN